MRAPWLLALVLLAGSVAAQNVAPGLTLYGPNNSTDVYLVDRAGEIVHTWPTAWEPGVSVYLLENGNLLRTKHSQGTIGGSGGGVQEIAWDGTVVWDYDFFDADTLHHHEARPLPNGNVLLLAWDHWTVAEAIAQGRDPALVTGTLFSPEMLVEVEPLPPTGGNIVWEWRLKDHLVQDFDAGQANFGVVADHPELVDINYPPVLLSNGDWIHANGIDYNPALDQILFSANRQDEIWVLDHSTTTLEAAGHTGGNSGRGGDLLYRWGNPAAYDTAGTTVLDAQHNPTWIPPGYPGEGHILLFNNRAGGTAPNLFSAVLEIAPPVDAFGNYALTPGSAYGPASPVWEYTAPVPTDFFSGFVSGAQRLPNGNTFICSGAQGWFFEVTPQKNLVWEYQNELPSPTSAVVFRATKVEHYLFSETDELIPGGAPLPLHLVAGAPLGNRAFLLLASRTGAEPSTPIGPGVELPLALTQVPGPLLGPATVLALRTGRRHLVRAALELSPDAVLLGLGNLDPSGKAEISASLPAGSPYAGEDWRVAFLLFEPDGTAVLASNALRLSIGP